MLTQRKLAISKFETYLEWRIGSGNGITLPLIMPNIFHITKLDIEKYINCFPPPPQAEVY